MSEPAGPADPSRSGEASRPGEASGPDEARPEDPLAVLRRWEVSGGIWVVRSRDARGVDVALLTCDAGEEMARIASADPALLAYLGTRNRSDD
jgi:hypothetical protein